VKGGKSMSIGFRVRDALSLVSAMKRGSTSSLAWEKIRRLGLEIEGAITVIAVKKATPVVAMNWDSKRVLIDTPIIVDYIKPAMPKLLCFDELLYYSFNILYSFSVCRFVSKAEINHN